MRPYLVIDLEATCDDGPRVPRHEMEIIEIGAVLVDPTTLTPLGEWQTFIRPVRHPILTPFCRKLTSITQAQVEAAPLFPEAIRALAHWLMPHPTPVFASWGAYDKNQLDQDAHHHGIRLPLAGDHVNLKQAFSDRLGVTKRYGMAGALAKRGIPLEGTHHRGIDDARNISKLLPFCLGHEGG